LTGGRPSTGSRIASAAFALVVNAIFWFAVPLYLIGVISQTSAGTDLTYGLVVAFGATITAIEVLAALTRGSALAAVFNAGASLASAFYVYLATGGGTLSVTASGVTVEVSFPVLVALMILPSFFNAARLGVTFLLEESEGSQPMSEEVGG